MLESGAKLRDIATDTGVAYKTLTAHLRAVGYRRGTLEYQIVRCYFHNCDKFSGDIVTAICDRYELTPEELKELIERETATVVECYKVQRSFQRTRAALVDRYGVKPSDQFIHGVLERFGVDVLISPEPTQPEDAVFVPDPNGVYCGFWLTEEQAIRLAEIRYKIRCRGNGNVFHVSKIGEYLKNK